MMLMGGQQKKSLLTQQEHLKMSQMDLNLRFSTQCKNSFEGKRAEPRPKVIFKAYWEKKPLSRDAQPWGHTQL